LALSGSVGIVNAAAYHIISAYICATTNQHYLQLHHPHITNY